MSVIKISNFGGLAPSVSPRELGLDRAQTNSNLFPATTEFRPYAADRDIGYATGVTNPTTIYKQTRIAAGGAFATETQGWKVSASLINYVKGPIDDDLTERTYYSYNDGATAPRVFDVNAVDKPLGVTPPSAAPTVTLTRGDKYTIDEDTAARNRIPAEVKTAILGAATETLLGDVVPTLTAGNVDGWLYKDVVVTNGNPATQPGEYIYCILMTSTTAGYVVPSDQNWALAPELRGRQVVYGTYNYWAVPMMVRASGWSVNGTTLTSSLKNINNPDPDFVRTVTTGYTGATPTKQLAPDTTCSAISSFVVNTYAATSDPQASHIEELNRAQAAVVTAVREYVIATPQVASVKNFYSTFSNVSAYLTSAIAGFADQVCNMYMGQISYFTGAVYTASEVTTLRTALIALFPSTFTVAGVGSNTLMNFTGTNGALAINSANVRSGVDGALTARITAALPTHTAYERQAYKNAILAELDRAILPALFVAVSDQTMKSMFPTSWPSVSDPADRLRTVLQRISELRAACLTVVEDYNRHNREMLYLIDGMFDRDIAPYMPTPRAAVLENRAYVTTWVTTWLEESAPSDVSAFLEDVDPEVDTCTVTKPANTIAGELQVGWRLYRSNSGSNGTDFQLVVPDKTETGAVYSGDTFLYFATSLASYPDTKPGYKLGEAVPTPIWLKPEAKLKGLVGMANGILAGFFDNVVCFCESFRPYAWPEEYQLTTRSPIVGMEAVGTSLFVVTRGSPHLFSGTDPSSISAVEIPSTQSCVSQRSIAALESGIIYASPDGLCFFSQQGVEVITYGLFSRDDWTALVPSSIVAAYHDGVYHFTYTGNGGGSYAVDLNSKKLVSTDISGSAFFVDKATDTMYFATGTTIKAVFGSASKRTGTYRSGKLNMLRHQPLAWLKVFGDFSSSVTVKWYGDGVLRHTATVTSTDAVRLPPGRYLEHEVEVVTASRVTQVVLCSTTEELQAV